MTEQIRIRHGPPAARFKQKNQDLWSVLKWKSDPSHCAICNTSWASGNCETPVNVHLDAGFKRFDGKPIDLNNRTALRFLTNLYVRCRKCMKCRKANMAHWSYRTEQELARASRARLITLTYEYQANTQRLYKEVRDYIRRLRHVADHIGKRDGHPATKLRPFFVIERGSRSTQRLHIHMIMAEYGHPIPRRYYIQRRRQRQRDGSWRNTDGRWLAGFVDTHLISGDPRDAAHYVVKYLAKQNGLARLPGGRRISAAPFWGPGHGEFRAAVSKVEEGTPADGAALAAQREAERERAVVGPTLPPSYAIWLKSRPADGEHNAPQGPPQHPFQTLAALWPEGPAYARLIPFDEIPPEIVKAWGLKPEA